MCGFNDDTAFKILVQLSLNEKILAIGLYEDNFPLNRLYCELFWKLLRIQIPKLYEKLKKSNISD